MQFHYESRKKVINIVSEMVWKRKKVTRFDVILMKVKGNLYHTNFLLKIYNEEVSIMHSSHANFHKDLKETAKKYLDFS